MSLEEARCAVVNVARALRQSGMVDVRLDALYGALDALDAVGAADGQIRIVCGRCSGEGFVVPDNHADAPDYRAARGCLPWQPGMPSPEDAIRRGRDTGFCQADPECWRRANTADGTCYHHSEAATLPSLRRRAPELAVQDAD